MLYREIIAVCSQIHTKHINTVWAERRIAVFKPGGTYSDHCAVHIVTTAVLTLTCAHAAPCSLCSSYTIRAHYIAGHCTLHPQAMQRTDMT